MIYNVHYNNVMYIIYNGMLIILICMTSFGSIRSNRDQNK